MKTSAQLYEEYITAMHRIADIKAASAVLQWDQETYLPPKGAHFRGQQLSTLSEMAHGLFSKDDLGLLLDKLSARNDLSSAQQKNIERTRQDYLKNKKYTSSFVRALSNQINKTFHAWIEARKQNNFAVYHKDLDALIALKKEETQILGYTGHPYNALLDEFEKGATVELLDKTFDTLLPQLQTLYEKILAAPQVDDSFLQQTFPTKEQWDWGMKLIKALHFDTEAGRQDISEHPFSTTFSPQDVRITTRIDENDFGNMTWSCIHETGHALYEQGLPAEQYGLPLGEPCSFSIHESQSRLWENNVGRSEGFWRHFYPQLQQKFPSQFGGLSLPQFYKGINKVQPSLIRTEADEISYHFHVYIRYQLEKKLIEGSLDATAIPDYWNGQYKKYLNVTVPDDKRGCLQDVHWSHGSFGYFPTYSLGSFYAAQFFLTALREMPNLEKDITEGSTTHLLNWLRQKIHSRGRFYTSEELCREVCGEGLNPVYFMEYVNKKYAGVYKMAQ